jgi:hypothetical protein
VAGRVTTVPGWQRRTRGEHRWPTVLALVVAIALQVRLPAQFMPVSPWLLPGIEALLGVLLLLANPFRIDRESKVLRMISIALITILGVATAWSVVVLLIGLVHNRFGNDAPGLLFAGGSIIATNIIAAAFFFWEFDRGGPAARAMGRSQRPAFLFAQMTAPDMVDKDWEADFVDYLYLAFTNSTAFSPTDTLPLTRWAKLAMMFQSAISLVTVVLVVARAVNVLGS